MVVNADEVAVVFPKDYDERLAFGLVPIAPIFSEETYLAYRLSAAQAISRARAVGLPWGVQHELQ